MIDVDFLEKMSAFIPSEEEMHAKNVRLSRDNPTAYHNWVASTALSAIPSPKTTVIPFPLSLQEDIVNGNIKGVNDAMVPIVEKVKEAGLDLGWPLFIKTSLAAGKHGWKDTCFFEAGMSDAEIADQLANLYYHWCFAGPGLPVTEFVVREFIQAKPEFIAFEGEMPITREFRFFIDESGEVDGFQPYWPERAIENEIDEEIYPDWREKLAEMSLLDPHTQHLLADEASKVVIDINLNREDKMGYSVDFLQDKDGQWYLIDMAVAHQSFKCNVGFRALDVRPEKQTSQQYSV